MTAPLQPARLLYRAEEAAVLLSIGRGRLYELIASGELESVKFGGRRRIPAQALDDFVERLRSTA